MIKQAICKKLKSNTGASLSIALLLFLVCTVLGSVILKSGTAASGRVSDMAAADARYYSVTSAADYLADAITTVHVEATPTQAAHDVRRTVSIERKAVTTTEETSSYVNEAWGDPVNTGRSVNYSIPAVTDNSSTGTANAETILTAAVNDIFFGGSPQATEACWSKDNPSIENADNSGAYQKEYDFSLTFTNGTGGSERDDLTVYVNEVIKKNGDLVLTVSDAQDAGDAGYRMQMLFVLTSKTHTGSTSRTTSDTTGTKETDDLKLIETTKTTETKTTTCYWTLAEIRKVN